MTKEIAHSPSKSVAFYFSETPSCQTDITKLQQSKSKQFATCFVSVKILFHGVFQDSSPDPSLDGSSEPLQTVTNSPKHSGMSPQPSSNGNSLPLKLGVSEAPSRNTASGDEVECKVQ